MVHHLKQLYGNRLGATDGVIGHVKDVYFDDRRWVIRYVVADTGTWLPQRQVLLPPQAFGKPDHRNNVLLLNLSRKQIDESPSIESHRPVSRQYETEYYRYHGWPVYLRSTRAVTGYQVHALDGYIGHVIDFLVDEDNWAITEIIVQVGHWYSPRHVRISPWDIERISYERSTVFTLLSAEDIEQTGEHMLAAVKKENLAALGLEE